VKIYIESKDLPRILTAKLMNAIDSGSEYINRHGHKGIEAIHVDELEFLIAIVYGAVTETGTAPWDDVEIYIPKLNRICHWGSYTYGSFDGKCCCFVGGYWGIFITVEDVSRVEFSVAMTKVLIQGR